MYDRNIIEFSNFFNFLFMFVKELPYCSSKTKNDNFTFFINFNLMNYFFYVNYVIFEWKNFFFAKIEKPSTAAFLASYSSKLGFSKKWRFFRFSKMIFKYFLVQLIELKHYLHQDLSSILFHLFQKKKYFWNFIWLTLNKLFVLKISVVIKFHNWNNFYS